MTSRERILSAVHGRPTDYVPVAPYMGNFGAAQAEIPIGIYNHDGKRMAEAQIRAWELFRQDAVVAQSDNYYIAEGFGCVIEQPQNSTPHLVKPAVSDLDQIDRLRVPDPYSDGRMPVYLEAVGTLRAHFGNEVAVRGPGTGPFSLASYIAGGTESFLTELALVEAEENPQREKKIMRLMGLASDALIAFLRALLEAGSDFLQAGDSLASLSMISPMMYEKYVWPFEKKVFESINPIAHEKGAVTLLHICGDTTRILPLMAATGADILEVDTNVDLSMARRILGPEVCLMGNIDPVGELLMGDPDSVSAACVTAISAAGSDRGRFILGSGCEVPPAAPAANLLAMIRTARTAT
ncbi:MAG TPA: uroporphyrinogen decarboxylase family protein [Spirochaetia bacterium]|nr:uroporphyrinogen decarboxylase family protein [Spirochaetia bacterium]